MLFTDDIVLIRESQKELRADSLEEKGLRTSRQKMELVAFNINRRKESKVK